MLQRRCCLYMQYRSDKYLPYYIAAWAICESAGSAQNILQGMLKYEERKLNNLTLLSSFFKKLVSNDARLYIAKENRDKAYVAPEKLS